MHMNDHRILGKNSRETAKTAKQLERYFKGAANHWRIGILSYVSADEGATLEEIAEALEGNIKTISEHTHRLVKAGLLNNSYRGRTVAHALSPYGKRFIAFMKTFQHS